MITKDAERSLADVVTSQPGAARVLEQFGLDYCCGGRMSLADACAEHGIDPAAVLAELAALAPQPQADWATMSVAQLVDHVELTHHAYLHRELPRLSPLAAKVAQVHGDRHGELLKVAATFEALRADLEPHLRKEEMVLFPAIRELAGANAKPSFHFGSVSNPITMMMNEHDGHGEVLAELRALTDGFRTPADGCASYQALYQGLAELEADTHLHVHKENNLLFPAVRSLEAELPDR